MFGLAGTVDRGGEIEPLHRCLVWQGGIYTDVSNARGTFTSSFHLAECSTGRVITVEFMEGRSDNDERTSEYETHMNDLLLRSDERVITTWT